MMEEQVATLDSAFETYGRLRREWDSFAEANTEIDEDGVATTEFRGVDAGVARFKAHTMNALVSDLTVESERTVLYAKKTCRRLNDAFQTLFGSRAGVTFDFKE